MLLLDNKAPEYLPSLLGDRGKGAGCKVIELHMVKYLAANTTAATYNVGVFDVSK